MKDEPFCELHEQTLDTIQGMLKEQGKLTGNVELLLDGQKQIFQTINTLTITVNENRLNISGIRTCTDGISDSIKDMCKQWKARSEEVESQFGEHQKQIKAIVDENNEGMLGLFRNAFRKKVGQVIVYGLLIAVFLVLASHLNGEFLGKILTLLKGH